MKLDWVTWSWVRKTPVETMADALQGVIDEDIVQQREGGEPRYTPQEEVAMRFCRDVMNVAGRIKRPSYGGTREAKFIEQAVFCTDAVKQVAHQLRRGFERYVEVPPEVLKEINTLMDTALSRMNVISEFLSQEGVKLKDA